MTGTAQARPGQSKYRGDHTLMTLGQRYPVSVA